MDPALFQIDSKDGGGIMAGLARTKDTTSTGDAWTLFVLGVIERVTYSLRRGDAFSEKAVNDMLKLQRRLSAFSDALDGRMPVVEED